MVLSRLSGEKSDKYVKNRINVIGNGAISYYMNSLINEYLEYRFFDGGQLALCC